VQDVLTIRQGNPLLRNQATDSYEVNLHYHRNKVDAGVIIYDRETSDLWAQKYTVIDGVNVFTFVNSGNSRDRGAELDVNTPIAKRVKLSVSLNLFDERVPVDPASGPAKEDTFRYTTNSTLEWDGPDRGKVPGDIAQLQWQYSSPSRQFQLRDYPWNWLSVSYTHSFSRSLSLSGTATYQGTNRHRLIAPLVQEFYSQRTPVLFKLKLLKTFGKP
jgi:outer membrane receptor for ferrienterochelin and colicin